MFVLNMRRNLFVTIVCLWVFILGAVQWTRAISFFVRKDFLADLSLSIPLPYAIVSAVVWGGLLWLALVGLWQEKEWARVMVLVAVTASQSQQWLDRFMFMRSDYAQFSTGFTMFISAASLLITWALLWKKFDNQSSEVIKQ